MTKVCDILPQRADVQVDDMTLLGCRMHVSCANRALHLRPLLAYADHFNWCVVPDKSYDAVLFGARKVLSFMDADSWYVLLQLPLVHPSSCLHACCHKLLTHRWCPPSISLTFQDWSTWQWHCNLAGHSACRPVSVHLPAAHACGRSSTHRLFHFSEGTPITPYCPGLPLLPRNRCNIMATVFGLCSSLVNGLCSFL